MHRAAAKRAVQVRVSTPEIRDPSLTGTILDLVQCGVAQNDIV
jgi:hypothetical protein